MKWVWITLGVVGSGGLVFALSRSARDVVSDTVADVSKAIGTTRGFRNNNPGNIRESHGDKTAWNGERSTDDDGAFEEFVSPEYGYRALVRILDGYRTRYGLSSVAGIIGRYAPSSENDTTRYVEFVAGRLGVSGNASIDTSDGRVMFRLIDAITRFENGGNPYADDVLHRGIELARGPIVT